MQIAMGHGRDVSSINSTVSRTPPTSGYEDLKALTLEREVTRRHVPSLTRRLVLAAMHCFRVYLQQQTKLILFPVNMRALASGLQVPIGRLLPTFTVT